MRIRMLVATFVVTATATLAAAPVGAATARGKSDGETIRLVTHDSFAVSQDVLDAFTARTRIKVEVLQGGDAGTVVNQAILTKDNPIGDVLFGVDNTFLTRALQAGIFARYQSPALETVPASLRLDPKSRVTPVDYGDVCINYDKEWFASHKVEVPKTLQDLTKPAYKGKLVVEDPSTSSPGLAFLLATVAEFGEDGWQDYWQRLRDNGVTVVDGWEQAYNEEFSGAAAGEGDHPLVVSYASSPPAEVIYADPRPKRAPTASLLSSCFRQIEFAGILDGTAHRRAAEQVVDFLLSRPFQEDMPLQMFVYPVLEGAQLPPAFVKYAQVAPDPLSLPPAEIAANRDRWIDQWTDIVLR
jgi:thiamine transport system substrate-binding protein